MWWRGSPVTLQDNPDQALNQMDGNSQLQTKSNHYQLEIRNSIALVSFTSALYTLHPTFKLLHETYFLMTNAK